MLRFKSRSSAVWEEYSSYPCPHSLSCLVSSEDRIGMTPPAPALPRANKHPWSCSVMPLTPAWVLPPLLSSFCMIMGKSLPSSATSFLVSQRIITLLPSFLPELCEDPMRKCLVSYRGPSTVSVVGKPYRIVAWETRAETQDEEAQKISKKWKWHSIFLKKQFDCRVMD